MSELTDEDLAAIRARVEAATPGPWVHQITTACYSVIQGGDRRSDHVHLAMMGTDGDGSPYNEPETYPNGDNDAEFIAHAREDVPALVAEVERLRNLLTGALDAHDAFLARYRIGSNRPPAERHFKALEAAKAEVAALHPQEPSDE